MPQPLCDHAAAAMGGKIYVTGGRSQEDGFSVNSAYIYDPQANTWAQLASMGNARRTHASAAVGGKLYVFGGIGDEEYLSTAECYDPALGSWAQASSLTPARSYFVAAAL